MKLTKRQLRKIIKEELEAVTLEASSTEEAFSLETAGDYVWERPRRSSAKDLLRDAGRYVKKHVDTFWDPERGAFLRPLPRGYYDSNNGNIALVMLYGDDPKEPKYRPLVNYADIRQKEYEGPLNYEAVTSKIMKMLKAAGFQEAGLPVPMSSQNLKSMYGIDTVG